MTATLEKPIDNPFRDPARKAQQIKKIQEARGVGPIAAAEPLPKEKGCAVHRAVIGGVPVHLKFDQHPPAGSIHIPQDGKWTGTEIFLDPTGEAWVVPSIWYNQPWSARIEGLEFNAERAREKASYAQSELDRLAASGKYETLPRAKQTEWRNLQSEIDQAEESILKINRNIEHIRKHATLDECPHLNPIPEFEKS